MEGTLYLCATPIGNLDDITFRVLETLKQVDLIAAEDTRHSIKLLNHFDIHTPMTSYHEYNKVEKARVLVEKLKSGMNIACITDAGTPGISDPGEELVRQCCEAGIKVTALPGAVACVTALIISGDGSVLRHFFRRTRRSTSGCLQSFRMRRARLCFTRRRTTFCGRSRSFTRRWGIERRLSAGS